MEYTNEKLKIMHDKKQINAKYAKWYYAMHQEFEYVDNAPIQYMYRKKSERINDCMNLWLWDVYHNNKIMDLQRVNRCKNTHFCPNCRLLDISKTITKFKDTVSPFLADGYALYLLTLTVPNCSGSELDDTLKAMSSAFRKLVRKYHEDGVNAFKNRSVCFDGGIRVLEITYNDKDNTYHPHYHCVILIKNPIQSNMMDKTIAGKYSRKRGSIDKKSYMDCEIGQLWSFIYQGIAVNRKNINNYQYIPSEICLTNTDKRVLEVDFREMDYNGFYEVFKYTFKDADISTYNVFKHIAMSLSGKRIRNGFGLLKKIDWDNVDVGVGQDLVLEKEEAPESLLTKSIQELYVTFANYHKISRYQCNIDDNIDF